jgi:hypothetical protein
MAASRVQFSNGQNSAGGSYNVVLPAGTGNGNLLVVCVGGFDPSYGNFVDLPNISDNQGNQYVPAADVELGNDRLTIFYVPGVKGGTQTLTVYQAFPSTCVAIEYAGLANQVDVVASANTTTDPVAVTTWADSTLVTSGSGVIVGFAVAISLVAAAFAAGAGYTLVVEQDDTVNGTSSAAFERLNAASQTAYSVNGTVGSATRVDSLSVAFK